MNHSKSPIGRGLMIGALTVLLLFPILLYEENLKLERRRLIPTRPSEPQPSRPASSLRRPKMPVDPRASFDRKGFLVAFEAQADRMLVSCLRAQMGERGEIRFIARLSHSGDLTAVRAIHLHADNLECVRSALGKMNFSGLGAGLPLDTIEVTWKFEW